jgi:hypothetical protein
MTGIDGKWEGKQIRDGNPRVVKIDVKIEPTGPTRVPAVMGDTRVYLGTLEYEALTTIDHASANRVVWQIAN